MKRPVKEKLFSKLVGLSIPDSIMEFRGGQSFSYRIDYQKVPVAAFMVWPSGKPCLAVNMYLLERSRNLTGDSVVTIASNLSELVRYCADGHCEGRPRSFSALNDSDIAKIIERLVSEVHLNDTTQRVRNNNTVRAIMHAIFDFLNWYQESIYVGHAPLIGTRAESASIVIKKERNSYSNHLYFHHRFLPPKDTKDPKLPISTSMIEVIEATIDELERPESYSAAALRRFGKVSGFLNASLRYLAARRNFMILIMRIAGLRPSEMVSMSVKDNDQSVRLNQPVLILPTMKRRKLNPPLRRFPITTKHAMRIRLYLRSRGEWIEFLKKNEIGRADIDAMFLSAEPGNCGAAVGRGALTKDFANLCKKAGIKDQQSCFSMFRHRFITDLVDMHLMAFDSQKGALNKQDYRTLLEKVREKTGHRSIDSLWHYIDLVRDMTGIWDSVGKSVERLYAAEQFTYELRELRSELKGLGKEGATVEQITSFVEARLTKIIGDAVILK